MFEKLEKSFLRRKALIEKLNGEKTNVFRFFAGKSDGIPGLIIDCYSKVAIFQVHDEKCRLNESELKEIAVWVTKNLSLESVYLKRFIQDRSHAKPDTAHMEAKPFYGVPSDPQIQIEENGVQFFIRPFDGVSVGLFLDQRKNRSFISSVSRGKRLLNLFSYTCGFSVAAALQGATVTSVDASKKYLEWGKSNFELNGIDPTTHTFISEDGVTFLEKSLKRGKQWDVIVLDPPSFGRSKAGVFSLKRDHKKLVDLGLQLLSENGILFFSCNFAEWDQTHFENLVAKAVENVGMKVEALELDECLEFKSEEHTLLQICLKKLSNN